MKRIVAGLLVGIAGAIAAFTLSDRDTQRAPDAAPSGRVVRVVDGDTIHVLVHGQREKVRLIGIDTPEPDCDQPYSHEATAFARRELDGKRVWLETDQDMRDRYGRMLAYVWTAHPQPARIAHDMFNARLAAGGYARQLTVTPNTRYEAQIHDLVGNAQRARRGLWQHTSVRDSVQPCRR